MDAGLKGAAQEGRFFHVWKSALLLASTWLGRIDFYWEDLLLDQCLPIQAIMVSWNASSMMASLTDCWV